MTPSEVNLRKLLRLTGERTLSHVEMAKILGVTERTIRRGMRTLKAQNVRLSTSIVAMRLPGEMSGFCPDGSSPVRSTPTQDPKPIPSKEDFAMSNMPKFYTSHDDQRLYYLAYRWAKEVGVKLYPSEVAKAMQELEEAGALEMSEEQPLPEIRWRPARPNGPRASEQPERKPQQAADYFSSDIAALKKVMGGE